MKYRGTLLLVALTLLLGGFYLLYQRPRVEAEKVAADFQKRFFRADAKEIVSITVQNQEGTVAISHGPDGWMIENPYRRRPDDGMIRKLLETIANGRLVKVVGGPDDLSQFGFNQPVLSLTLGLNSGREELLIGQKNPADTGYYAYSEGLGKIFIVNKELPKELYLRLYDLREKRLYPAVVPDDIGRVVIARGGERVELVFSSGGWRMIAPIAGKAGDAEVRELLRSLTEQKAVEFFPWEKKLAQLPQRIRLQLFDRSNRMLADSDIAFWGTGGDEGIVVREPGAVEAARTRREFWEMLQTDAGSLLERTLFPIDTATVTRIAVSSGSEQMIIERSGKRWTKNGLKIDADNLPHFLDALSAWKGAKVVSQQVTTTNPQTVIEVTDASGLKKLLVTGIDMTNEFANTRLNIQAQPNTIARKDVSFWLASASALSGSVLVGSHEVDRILQLMRDLK